MRCAVCGVRLNLLQEIRAAQVDSMGNAPSSRVNETNDGGGANFCGFESDGESPIPRKRFLGSDENDQDGDQEALDESEDLMGPNEDDEGLTEQYNKEAMMMTGLSASAIIVGLWEVADQERLAGGKSIVGGDGEAEAVASLLRHVQGGMTTVDCADHYGSSERIIQSYLKLPEATQLPIEIWAVVSYRCGLSRDERREEEEGGKGWVSKA